MRTIHGTAALLGILASAATVGVACRPLPDCGGADELHGFLCEATGASSSGSGSSSSSGGGGGVDATVPPNCIPHNNKDPVADECGVFVSSSKGADSASGTKEQPLRTLAEAVAIATDQGKPVYACAEEFIEDAGVDVPSGVTIYGGLGCNTGWNYVGVETRTRVTALADVIPLRIKFGAGTTRLEDMHVLAHSAEMMSGSSIAVVVNGGSASFVRSLLEAGDAMPGMSADPFQAPAASGMTGANGGVACSAAQVVGATGPTNSCGNPDSVGGDGGNGLMNSGTPGLSGLPSNSVNGGAGEGAMACKPGTAGAAGVNGTDGADGTGLGTISASGYAGAAGTDGIAGTVGQGGGGGGGSKGGSNVVLNPCQGGASTGGASGGSGGSGGCGGSAGKGGGYGGSSIALVSLNATLSFEATALIARAGREGGSGIPGQDGGKGGSGGMGGTAINSLKPGCSGGPGGDGGKGGDGGDGAGGHSLGIAYNGAAPPSEGVTVTFEAAGPGAGDASDGVAQAMLEFP